MKTSIIKAIQLILSADAELLNILQVTAEMSIQSSILALLIGLPMGIWLGACKFPGRNVLLVANRTLMGMPPPWYAVWCFICCFPAWAPSGI